MHKSIFIFLFLGLSFSGCYYDVESEIYPADENQTCDTINVGYQARIDPIMKNNCNSCHGGTAESGNYIPLDSYDNLKNFAMNNNNRLLGSIMHTSAFPMPKGMPKLPDCDIKAIRKWIESGYPQ